MFVVFKGREYRVKMENGRLTLNLSRLEIKDISEIEGLEALTSLQVLNLSHNQISEITGLDSLSNLHDLDLSYNQIEEIEGFDYLSNLKSLLLIGNPIHNTLKWISGVSTYQKVLEYSRMSTEEREDLEKNALREIKMIKTRYCRNCKRAVPPESRSFSPAKYIFWGEAPFRRWREICPFCGKKLTSILERFGIPCLLLIILGMIFGILDYYYGIF